MRGVNVVHLLGNVGNDPEIRYTGGGMAIASVSLATTNVRKDKDGNTVENTSWHRVKFFGKPAEIIGEYVRKGSGLYVQGRIEYGSYEKDDGTKVYTTDIIGDEFQFVGGGQRDGGEREQRAPQQRQQQPRREAPPTGGNFGSDFADDNIPF